ncbi:hypothetical protein FJY90_06005 [Candidatus Gottesmanbacteria bacterium]|nr:hypothetical protein [Candidatus Gottesmanbacteria bacterium]
MTTRPEDVDTLNNVLDGTQTLDNIPIDQQSDAAGLVETANQVVFCANSQLFHPDRMSGQKEFLLQHLEGLKVRYQTDLLYRLRTNVVRAISAIREKFRMQLSVVAAK